MDLKEIQELIRILGKSNVAELRIERDNFKITLRTRDFYTENNRPGGNITQNFQPTAQSLPQAAPQQAPQAATPAQQVSAPAAAAESNLITIKSPMIGTFYRSTGPDKDPFVKVGDEIKPGSVICIIEAMKLFNEIESEFSGKIVKILVDNAKPVEYDQPLFLIEPN